jgi:hypothetical protein
MDTAELTKRALMVAEQYDSLEYMSAAGGFAPRDDERPFESDVGRYMVITHTDGGADGWVDFYTSLAAVEAKIRDCITDEWGVVAVHDLCEDDYEEPMAINYVVSLQVKCPISHG